MTRRAFWPPEVSDIQTAHNLKISGFESSLSVYSSSFQESSKVLDEYVDIFESAEIIPKTPLRMNGS